MGPPVVPETCFVKGDTEGPLEGTLNLIPRCNHHFAGPSIWLCS